MIASKEDIISVLQRRSQDIRGFGIERVGLFGSFLRGEQTPASDVDLLVEFRPGAKTFDHYMELAFFLEDALGRRVEIVTPESLSPYIGPRILEEVEYVPLTG